MKTKSLLTIIMMFVSLSVSAQIELLFLYVDNNLHTYFALDRTKKLLWLDDDDNTCFKITKYSKSGKKETFTLELKEDQSGITYDFKGFTTTVDDKGNITTLHVNGDFFNQYRDFKVIMGDKTNPEDKRIMQYFNELAGYPKDQGVSGVNVPSVGGGNNTTDAATGTVGKAKDAAKKALNKAKGLFKKGK